MRIPRKQIAQACTAVAGTAMFLPWSTGTGEVGTDSVQGIGTDEGQIVLVVCLVTIGLIQVGWRPAWIGVGFAGAVAVREILDISGGGDPDPASGLWVAVAATAATVVVLVWDLFAGVSAPGDDADGGDDEPGGRRLSGPLGRRQ